MGEYHKAGLPVEGNTKEPVRVELSGSGVETGYTSANVHELANDWGVEHDNEQHGKSQLVGT